MHHLGDQYNNSAFRQGAFVGGVKVGYSIYDQARLELAYDMRGRVTKDGKLIGIAGATDGASLNSHIRSNTLMLNAYYDIPTGSALTPFITAGAGVAFNKFGSTFHDEQNQTNLNSDGHKANFAWSAGLGVDYRLTENLSTNLTARYLDAGKIALSDNSSGSRLGITDLLVGLNYRF